MESPCKGGLDVSEKAFLSMLGTARFPKKPTVSYAEQKRAEILTVLENADNNLDLAASQLGLSKSSIKRILSSTEASLVAYNETNAIGKRRQYLEKNIGRWSVATLYPNNGTACVEMKNPSCTVRLSVSVYTPKNQII